MYCSQLCGDGAEDAFGDIRLAVFALWSLLSGKTVDRTVRRLYPVPKSVHVVSSSPRFRQCASDRLSTGSKFQQKEIG